MTSIVASLKAAGAFLRLARTGARLVIPRRRYRQYWRDASGQLARDLGLGSHPERVERAVAKAVRDAQKLGWRERLERVGEQPWASEAEFESLLDSAASKFPSRLRGEFPDAALPLDQYIGEHFVAAAKSAVAGSANDPVAKKILGAQGSAFARRTSWRSASLSFSVGVVASVATAFGLRVSTSQSPRQVVAALLAGAAGTATAHVVQLGRIGDGVVSSKQALRGLFDALLEHNAPDYKPASLTDRLDDAPCADQLIGELERLIGWAGYGVQRHKAPPRDVVYRFAGHQLVGVYKAAGSVADALARLHPHKQWYPPRCLLTKLDEMLDLASAERSQPYEYELKEGSVLLAALVCGAALAVALDQAAAAGASPPAATRSRRVKARREARVPPASG